MLSSVKLYAQVEIKECANILGTFKNNAGFEFFTIFFKRKIPKNVRPSRTYPEYSQKNAEEFLALFRNSAVTKETSY